MLQQGGRLDLIPSLSCKSCSLLGIQRVSFQGAVASDPPCVRGVEQRDIVLQQAEYITVRQSEKLFNCIKKYLLAQISVKRKISQLPHNAAISKILINQLLLHDLHLLEMKLIICDLTFLSQDSDFSITAKMLSRDHLFNFRSREFLKIEVLKFSTSLHTF